MVEVVRRVDSLKVPEREVGPFSWRKSVVYEAYPGGFEKNPESRNFLQEMTHRVKTGYFQDLGVDAIWIPPIYPSSGFDQGYDIFNYKDIAQKFGGMEAFDAFVTEAHRNGIKVIMDLVANHTSIEHPWYKEASSSKDNAKHNWYLFHEANPDGSAPSATLNAWGQPGWQKNPATGEYVWSSFSPEGQRDLNWENPEVQSAIAGIIDFWKDEHHVDGFRGDVLPFTSKDPSFYDPTSVVPANAKILNGSHISRNIELIASHIGEGGVLIPEVSINDALEVVEKAHGKQIFETPEEVDMVMDAVIPFHHVTGSDVAPVYFLPYYVDWDNAKQVKMVYDRMQKRLPSGAIPTLLISDHDESARGFSRLSPERARQAKLIEFTMPGVSIVYYGDEIAMQNEEVREGMRRDTLGRERARSAFNVKEAERQQKDPSSEFAFTRKLAEIKHTSSALSQGQYHPLELGEHVFGYMWADGNEKVIILNNFSNMDVIGLSLKEFGRLGQQLVTSKMDRNGMLRDLSQLALRPHESVVLRVVPSQEALQQLTVGVEVERDPHNPILSAEDVPGAVKLYNPTVLERQGDGKSHYDMFFREMDTKGISSIGHGVSRDGSSFSIDDKPAIPSGQMEKGLDSHGIEDGRITQMDTGEILMIATAFDGITARAVVTRPKNESFTEWEVPEIMFPDWHGGMWNKKENRGIILGEDEPKWQEGDANWSKSVGIFPKKINGEYCAFFGDDHIYLATSQDGKKWDVKQPVISARPGYFDNAYVEMGPAPIELDEGWLILYDGIDSFEPKRAYQVGAVIVDKNDPTKILYRSSEPILSAVGKEREGAVDIETNESGQSIYERARDGNLEISDSNVVFCNGAVFKGKVNGAYEIQLYYGSGDLYINTAKMRMKVVSN